MSDPSQIVERLGGREYRRLFEQVRSRLERAGPNGAARSLTLRGLDEVERRAIADLLGWRAIPSGDFRIHLEDLDAELRAGALNTGLRRVVEVLGGPLRDLPLEKAGHEAELADLHRLGEEHPAIADRAELRGWPRELLRAGIITRLAREAAITREAALQRLLDAVSRLPAPGVLLPVFAADLCGDAHALDAGRPMASGLLRAAARLGGWPELPESAPARRQLWAEVGVSCDALSADVLVLGIRPTGDALLARRLRDAAEAGEPQRVTLRELEPILEFGASTPVAICENPSVVAAAADQLGARCPPLVCVEGIPSSAALRLLRLLLAGGATFRVHADFDWAGVRIANALFALGYGEPWRFDAGDFQSAVSAGHRGPALADSRQEPSWSSSLGPAMADAGCSILEEQVLGDLLADLGAAAQRLKSQ
jgi:uncharacterized protein (TIGR02679 family)